jgi:acetyl esterase/lipase
VPVLPERVKRLLSGGRSLVIEGNTLDPTLQVCMAGYRLAGITGMVIDDDVARSRAMFSNNLAALAGPRIPVDVAELTIPGPAGPLGVRHYRAAGDPAPALVYFHGGGYVLGDLDGYDSVCRQMCRDAGTHVFSVDYRLAPEHPAPAAVDDCVAAFRWIVEHAGVLDVRPDRVAVGGDSAGGGLAAAVTQLSRHDGPVPALQLLLYPWTDISGTTRSRTLFASGLGLCDHDLAWFGERYLDGSVVAADDPRVSPGRATDLSGLPPALVVTAGFDPLRDEGNAYAAALAAAGVPVDLREMGPMTHGFINFNILGGRVSHHVAEVVSALRAHLLHG